MAEDVERHKTPRRPTADLVAPRSMRFRRQLVDCGRCPKWHGPYWYAFWKQKEPGRRLWRMRSAYIGSDARLAEVLEQRKAAGRSCRVDTRSEPLPAPRRRAKAAA